MYAYLPSTSHEIALPHNQAITGEGAGSWAQFHSIYLFIYLSIYLFTVSI